ncbi:MAG: DUF1294 domain-containing protein [Clostridia bacterium]|nr:DUF1294 domain-containing protein [Clostridia bacterium]
MNELFTVLFVWNVIVFLIYGTDKLLARLNARRISEKTLLLCTFAAGGIGALMGMEIWRHKTKHTNFRILVPIAAVITAVIGYFCKL